MVQEVAMYLEREMSNFSPDRQSIVVGLFYLLEDVVLALPYRVFELKEIGEDEGSHNSSLAHALASADNAGCASSHGGARGGICAECRES